MTAIRTASRRTVTAVATVLTGIALLAAGAPLLAADSPAGADAPVMVTAGASWH